jgi:hypothetical protein
MIVECAKCHEPMCDWCNMGNRPGKFGYEDPLCDDCYYEEEEDE